MNSIAVLMRSRRRRAAQVPFNHGEPIGRPPYAFVVGAAFSIVALMLSLSIDVPTHEFILELQGDGEIQTPTDFYSSADTSVHHVTIDEMDRIFWDDKPISVGTLVANLQSGLALRVEPEIVFSSAPNGSYELAANVLNVIQKSGVTKFRFGDLEQHRCLGNDLRSKPQYRPRVPRLGAPEHILTRREPLPC